MAYAELHCISNFSFLRGASHPEELVRQAAALGYQALAITDECSLAGVVRAYSEAKKHPLKLIIGSEFFCNDGFHLVLLAKNLQGYRQLSSVITRARRVANKGEYFIDSSTLAEKTSEVFAIWVPSFQHPNVCEQNETLKQQALQLTQAFNSRLYLAVELLIDGKDKQRQAYLQALSCASGIPAVACGDVHMHVRGRRALQDVLTAIRVKEPVDCVGFDLHSNGEHHLRKLSTLRRLYHEEFLECTLRIADQCSFCLSQLHYDYPDEIVPIGYSAIEYLRELSFSGARERWPQGVNQKVCEQINHELELIEQLSYEKYFLTVYDIVKFAKEQKILCQGRGSAANSAVCFCLGITAVDPARMSTLFERFISKERNEPPDIDVDFEHERREEVIQYVYQKYGRERVALAATVVCYRPRSAIRDVGKAMGLTDLQTDRLAQAMQWWDGSAISDERIVEAGFDPDNPMIRRIINVVRQLLGFPRHLSQHVGGFVISGKPLSELVPIENAAMEDRTVIQWDKDDLEDLGLLKVDVLGLGMLTAIRRSFDLIESFKQKRWSLASIPANEPTVYEMISRADTVGVFQIESRAQMSMLPRLKPNCFYDLVIEVAIVRPGPIQGDMVHPYLRRRNGEEPISYPSEEVKHVLQRTLGVPIFQEQVMHLAMVAAGFSADEADQLRRAMAAWKRKGGLGPFGDRLVNGMLERGYTKEFAERIFRQIQGFGEYGFPESHATSFALLVYVSAWLKRFEPAAFFCAMLNSLPMGFYAPAQLIRAAQNHDVTVLAVDANHSQWTSTLEADSKGVACIRLGFSRIKGFREAAAHAIVQCRKEGRKEGGFQNASQIAYQAGLNKHDMELLASAGALKAIEGHRYKARWQVAGIEAPTPLMPEVHIKEAQAMLNRPDENANLIADYNYLSMTLGRHPMHILRPHFQRENLLSAEKLWDRSPGSVVQVVGLVITRQRPGTASGVTFVTLEDETGYVNLVVWKKIATRFRQALLRARLMRVIGQVQKESGVLHLIAQKLIDETHCLGSLTTSSRDFH